MLSVDIEKEIQQKNKVLLGLTIRQVACVSFAIAAAIIMALLLTTELSLYPSLVVGTICYLFGWYQKDGLTAEKYLLKILKEKFYKNDKRKYRTKNRYVVLMNHEYRRHEKIDRSDKKIAKTLKKESKQNKKRVKQTHMKAIM